ncbi:MAG: 1-deoxy-D-xylulose-5-phosphate reductoisomerase [Xanthomonadales bacterium]|nr:1-deoxy-D-xylulose-5-phosphate reductoisomerase [Gammaproteobacteria bacterium]NNE06385.1 1-deoxy-D-xylulose-5-phosphate reductoisomerase [Xanthomonadales bacterium]NNL95577.1 1-deoxy-D-xylulose-5-phosphate reductoisomerase [Xanthomonadales bacterium]
MSCGITILGSTGSVGCSTLDVIARHPGRFHVTALAAHRNIGLLVKQCVEFKPAYAVTADPELEAELTAALKSAGCASRVMSGEAGLAEAVALDETDAVMAAIVGAAGLKPSLHAVSSGKRLMLANKESMVIAGELFSREAQRQDQVIIPVDSEHNALFQALPESFAGDLDAAGVEQLILTASGGPFLDRKGNDLSEVTPEQACDHPNWDMGRKISVDSATLMNKGLEVIEARWLFNAPASKISVLIHPQSIVHSLVAYRDGSVIAQLGMPDMRTPIAHALAWPDRIEAGVARLHLHEVGKLEFRQPDLQRFPCLRLAFEALESGGNSPVVLNAANECAVQAFLDGQIGFTDIPVLVEKTLETAAWEGIESLEDVIGFDRMGRAIALQEIQTMGIAND